MDSVRIIPFEARYRDDMIFMILLTKDSLGHVPRLNPDLLDVEGNYLRKGDMFWLAIDDRDRVAGCVGYSAVEGTGDVRLHRFYVKPDMQGRGIGSALYRTAEEHVRALRKTGILVHLGGTGYEASHSFYLHRGFVCRGEDFMYKKL
ncbi:MAG: GNAT family N-acetyltransferase [Ruminococcaceae bacterium]|jgi:hypothetical protein|nr:GNAT family N-acetyltransferase [Oscillospiraceae bacterium]